jgi:hypothetical protein
MAIIDSREGLAEYCKRKLGHPVMQINVTPDQIEDRIEDCFDMFREFHDEGTIRNYVAVKLTQDMIDKKSLPVPDNVYTVTRVIPFNSNSGFNKNLQIQMFMSDIMASISSSGIGGVSTFMGTKNYLALINDIFNAEPIVRFSRHMNKMFIDCDSSRLSVGQIVLIEGWIAIDPETYSDVYNDRWVKNFCTQLIKQNWGQNLKKYAGIQLPGGIVLDGQTIFDEATAEIARLEEELHATYASPINFMVG